MVFSTIYTTVFIEEIVSLLLLTVVSNTDLNLVACLRLSVSLFSYGYVANTETHISKYKLLK